MKRILFALVCFVSGGILFAPLTGKADIPLAYFQGSLAATGDSVILTLAGQSTCSVVTSGTWVGTVTPKGSSDRGVTYTTVASIAAQTSNGTFSGDISAYTTNFKISWTRTSGTLSYAISCSGAVSTANVTVTAANVTVVNTPGVAVVNTPTVNQGTSPWVVTTPPPTTTVTVNTPAPCTAATCNTTISLSGATPTPLPVTTPAPLPTQASGALTAQGTATVLTSSMMSVCSVSGACAPLLTGGVQGILGTATDSNGATSPIACDKQAVVNISSATTTSIVAASGATKVYVCAYSLYIVSGTLPSFVIEGGTGAACVTTQVPLTGTFGGIAGAIGELFNSPSVHGSVLRTAASSALCIVSGGTTPNIQGFVTYAQF